jgi:hypothetical protein
MSGNSGAPAAPNYSPITGGLQTLANSESALAGQQEGWGQTQVNNNEAVTNAAIGSDQAISGSQSGMADSIDQQYQSTYQPLENKFANEAENYASQGQIDANMGAAGAKAQQTGDQALANEQQTLEGYGISPDSTRYQALTQQGKVQTAASNAGAQNTARTNTINTGLGLESTAIGQGEVMPSMAAGTENLALQGNAGAVNAGLSTTTTGANVLGTAPQYYQLANGSYGAYGNALNQQFGNQIASFNADQNASSGLGALGGAALGAAGPIMQGAAKLAPFLMAAKGGAIGDDDQVGGNFDDVTPGGKPFVDHMFYAFDKDHNHIGVFQSPDHANDHIQRQDYAKRYAGGGAVDNGQGTQVTPQMSPSRGAVTDDVPAVTEKGQKVQLNTGEFVVPKDVVLWKGQEHFQKLIDKSREQKQEATAKPTPAMAPGPARYAQQSAVG